MKLSKKFIKLLLVGVFLVSSLSFSRTSALEAVDEGIKIHYVSEIDSKSELNIWYWGDAIPEGNRLKDWNRDVIPFSRNTNGYPSVVVPISRNQNTLKFGLLVRFTNSKTNDINVSVPKDTKEIWLDRDGKYSLKDPKLEPNSSNRKTDQGSAYNYIKNDHEDINNGVVFHAWNWSFDEITKNLKAIKDAGYTAVQTSPVQPTKEYTDRASNWWLLYQPMDFKVGNLLGTRNEFKKMVSTAKDSGIHVIVDVVLNHLANENGGDLSCTPHSKIPTHLQKPEFWKSNKCIGNWNDRNEITQNGIGLPDLNTSNKDLQKIIISFLKDMESMGVSGFRFDAAKHIELPNDSAAKSDFWLNILSALNKDTYVYGEVLQGDGDEITKYAQLLDVTASRYGEKLRHAMSKKSVHNLVDYDVNGLPTKDLVTWVGSHDTYANEHGESVWLSQNDLILSWALLTARKENTPLFFNRPLNNDLGKAVLGHKGDDLWRSKEIVAINKFHNEMKDFDEYIYNPNEHVAIIDRGNQGMIIVNLSDSDQHISQNVRIGNGSYVDKVNKKASVNINNGKLEATIKARSFIIVT